MKIRNSFVSNSSSSSYILAGMAFDNEEEMTKVFTDFPKFKKEMEDNER